MKRIKGIATILMVACMLVSCFMFNSTYAVADTVSVAPATPAEKIDAAIWDTAPDENGRYLVYISRDSITDESIENEFNKRNEFDLSDYKDKKTFRWEIGSSIAMNAFEKYGMRETFDIKVGRELFNDELVPIEYEFIEAYNEFIDNKRQVISDLYGDYNRTFIEACDINSNYVLYEGIYTGSYVLYGTRDEIEKVAQDDSVINITIYENYLAYPTTNVVHSQIHTDSLSGTNSTNFNNGLGYKGTGIKIGIIEACVQSSDNQVQYTSFNKDSPQLSTICSSKLFYVNKNGQIANQYSNNGDHANLVTSIIVGQEYSYNGQTYVGVVPNATVYQASSCNLTELLNMFQILVDDYNVNVINHSAAFLGADGYTYCDAEVDRMIRSTSVSFVTAAANLNTYDNPDNEVKSPALAYNAIAVGNLNTKIDSNNSQTTSTFSVHNSSSYVQYDYLTNKPDIVAPGMNIACIDEGDAEYVNSGTSFATPFVTGVIAQMFQADETLMGSPTRTKAVLLAGADITKVSTVINQIAYSGNTLIRKKSGLGMLNAIDAVNIAQNGWHANKVLFLDSTGNNGEHAITNVSLEAGQTIRIVLTYDKPNLSTTTADDYVPTTGCNYEAGLRIYDGSTMVRDSDLEYSNVEVLLYTADADEDISIKTIVHKYVLSNEMIPWRIAVAWKIS